MGYRPSKGETAHYTSLEQLREDFHLPKISKKSKNKEKVAKQQEQLLGKCKVCGNPLSYIYGTNVLACTNEECKGKKITAKSGEEFYVPVVKILDNKGTDIAINLFAN